jgi:hypothetical protein
MAQAFTPEWGNALSAAVSADADFMEKIQKFNKNVTARVLPSPEHGITETIVFGFDFPSCKYFFGEENGFDTQDYVMEGVYEDWYNVNEGIKGLVPSMMDQSVMLPKGSVSYIARFLPAIERYFQISRQVTDSYAGDFKVSDSRPD